MSGNNIIGYLFFCCIIILSSCGYRLNELPKKRFERIRIADASDIYGNYVFSYSDSMQLLEQIRKPSLVNKIIGQAREAYWPLGIQNLDNRIRNRAELYGYKVYRVANIGARSILMVPPDKNKHMPTAFQKKDPFYLVINIRATSIE